MAGLDRRKKKAVIANVAVARELAGWRWLPATLEQRGRARPLAMPDQHRRLIPAVEQPAIQLSAVPSPIVNHDDLLANPNRMGR
jgi:hypothetical protein